MEQIARERRRQQPTTARGRARASGGRVDAGRAPRHPPARLGRWTSVVAPPAQSGRRMQMASRPADELGVEESEFDKPTYLRRGIFAPE